MTRKEIYQERRQKLWRSNATALSRTFESGRDFFATTTTTLTSFFFLLLSKLNKKINSRARQPRRGRSVSLKGHASSPQRLPSPPPLSARNSGARAEGRSPIVAARRAGTFGVPGTVPVRLLSLCGAHLARRGAEATHLDDVEHRSERLRG